MSGKGACGDDDEATQNAAMAWLREKARAFDKRLLV